MFQHRLVRLGASLLLLTAFVAPIPVMALDTPSTSDSAAGPSMSEARALIKASDWSAAVTALKQIVESDPQNADAFNLLGYAYRNLGKYDLAGRAYAKALALDPRHTGALEYQGILFIKLGQRDKAEANLAKLKSICGTSCEEYADLAEALN